WGVKHTKRERDEQGKLVDRRQYFHGYKAHVSMQTGSDLITSPGVTPGNAYDGHRLPELVKSDVRKAVPVATVTADRAYDDGDNHYLLETERIHSAIILNRYRTEKKDSSKQIWEELLASEPHQVGIRERFKSSASSGTPSRGTVWVDVGT
ncbi:transposase, partial [Chloroflexota bacterium]